MPSEVNGEFVIIGPQSFGLAIREFRNNEGVTQIELAEKSGLNRSYIAELENGSTTNAVKYIVDACRALDLEIIVRPCSKG